MVDGAGERRARAAQDSAGSSVLRVLKPGLLRSTRVYLRSSRHRAATLWLRHGLAIESGGHDYDGRRTSRDQARRIA
jgi:hypothetical protein